MNSVTLPTPANEFQLFIQIDQLRKSFVGDCFRLLGIAPAKDTFDRWLFDQLSVTPEDTSVHSLNVFLKYPQLAVQGSVLKKELLNLVPTPLYLSWTARNSRKAILGLIHSYIDASMKWFTILRKENLTASLENNFKKCRKYITELEKWIEMPTISLEEAQLKLQDLKQESPLFYLFSERVNEICQNLLERSTHSRSVVQLKSDVKHIVGVKKENNRVIVSYGNDAIVIHLFMYHKLADLYNLNGNEKQLFNNRLYVLLRRYETLFGDGGGIHFQAAVTEPLFQFLSDTFGVESECFASPLNCYYPCFNSAFYDTDRFFGSRGSFFNFYPKCGSFEVNPPFTEEVIFKTAKHLLYLLNTGEALSFIVFVPDWKEPYSEGLRLMDESKHRRTLLFLKGGSYSYVKGNIQRLKGDRYFTAPFNTRIYILQNNEGALKWPVTNEKLKLLRTVAQNKH